MQPSTSAVPVTPVDPRSLPHSQAEGAYGNQPTQERANRVGFRRQAPQRGLAAGPGIGTIRNAVERGQNFFVQFGRVFRRFDQRNVKKQSPQQGRESVRGGAVRCR